MATVDLFTRRAVKAACVVALFIVAWILADVFVLVFGGIIVAATIGGLARALARRTSMPQGAALAAVMVGLPVLIVGVTWLVGSQLSAEIGALRTTLPEAVEAASRWLQEESPIGMSLPEIWEAASQGGVPWTRVASFASIGLTGIANGVLIVFLGLYFAASPRLYFRGALDLVPDDMRARVAEAFVEAGDGLEKWLFGQALSMIAIGALTMLGLSLLGAPLAMAMGLVAGLLAFIPFFGPIGFAGLAIVLAFTQSPNQALYVGLLCIAIQQLEGYVITPFIQRWAVALPPALGLLAVVIFGLLFGVMGVVFATPMMVVLIILVRKLYVESGPSPPVAPEKG